jgi:exopolyphosphatase/guanosine-5'-triphosphate,3'-diphosphate pyrophosphatase
VRDASNRDDFLSRASLPVRVLPLEEEARYGYLAAVNSTTLADGAVLDLGGGSVQLVCVEGRRATEIGSWPLGAVRVTERFLADGGPATRKQLKAVRAYVASELESAPWIRGAGGRLVGIGGTVRNLAAAAAALAGRPSFGVQGAVVTRKALDERVELLAGVPAEARGKVAGIKPARAELILAGAVVIQAIAEVGGFEAVEATEAGLREGVFFERHLAGREPPLFDDVRRATVHNLANQYTPDRRHSDHVARLTLEMFDDLATAGLHGGDAAERELVWAAAELHDIGMAVDYDDHHKHSRYLILSSGLPGFSPREAAIIAEMVRYHRKGTPAFGDDLAPLVSPGDREILTRGAALLRLAEGLERSRDQSVRSVAMSVDGAPAVQLVLDADGDVPVARWAAEREVDLFRRAFDRALEITER